jgi:flagellar biosynthesis/type III secretory pathway protein FliH
VDAARILEAARREAAQARLQVETEARADAAAAVAARAVALAAREAASLDRQRERVVELARALAERLLGEQLRLDPTTIVSLADQVLAEARGAREVTIAAHPADVPHLRAALDRLRAGSRAVEITSSNACARGALRVETEIGTLDAELAPQLHRLAARLAEVLES